MIKRRRKHDFLERHPACCFCGGEKAATTRDHVPPRAVFNSRVWPEGYEFPSCASCNGGSRQLDQTLALLARMSVFDQQVDPGEFVKYRVGVRNNEPSALPRLPCSEREVRSILRELGREMPPGARWDEVPVALISADTFRNLDSLFWKIYCAMHYMHLGKIVPQHAALARLCTTNQVFGSPNPLGWQSHHAVKNAPQIKRSGKCLRDQFDYLWGVDHEGSFGLSFHLRWSIFGMIAGPIPADQLANIPDELLLRYSPNPMR